MYNSEFMLQNIQTCVPPNYNACGVDVNLSVLDKSDAAYRMYISYFLYPWPKVTSILWLPIISQWKKSNCPCLPVYSLNTGCFWSLHSACWTSSQTSKRFNDLIDSIAIILGLTNANFPEKKNITSKAFIIMDHRAVVCTKGFEAPYLSKDKKNAKRRAFRTGIQ